MDDDSNTMDRLDGNGLHNRSATTETDTSSRTRHAQTSSSIAQETHGTDASAYAYANGCGKLDRQIRVAGTIAKAESKSVMHNRVRIINGAIVSGTLALFVMSFSAMNFIVILFASPETIAKMRYLKFGMSVSGSICVFVNALCIFVLCVEVKYAIQHYVKNHNNDKN